MPLKNGFQATREIKSLPNASKIIIVTLHDEMEYFSEAVNCGADGFISKAHFAEKVFDVIDKVFSNEKGEAIAN